MGPHSFVADAVLFDSDGVLVDSHDQVSRAWTLVGREYGLDVDALLGELAGRPARATLARHVEPGDLDAACRRLEDVEVELAADTRPIGGALDLLAALPRGRWTIVTSATRRLASARWTAAGIAPPDDAVVVDDVVNGKPAAEPFLTAAARLGVDPRGCVVFEDSAAGGQAATAAGATVIAVGDQPWHVEPSARVAHLGAVSVARHGGRIRLDIGSVRA